MLYFGCLKEAWGRANKRETESQTTDDRLSIYSSIFREETPGHMIPCYNSCRERCRIALYVMIRVRGTTPISFVRNNRLSILVQHRRCCRRCNGIGCFRFPALLKVLQPLPRVACYAHYSSTEYKYSMYGREVANSPQPQASLPNLSMLYFVLYTAVPRMIRESFVKAYLPDVQ